MRLAKSHQLIRKKLHLERLSKNRRGVTLLELAIVLAVIGALTGALFAAASFANYRANFNQASDQLNEIAINMRNLFAGRNTSYATINAATPLETPALAADFANFTPTFIQQNIFPNEMLSPPVAAGVPPASTTVANTAWGSAQIALAGKAGAPVQFVIRYTNINPEICADLITHNSLPGRGTTGLTQIIVNGTLAGSQNSATYPNPNPLPIPSTNAATACSSTSGATTYTIDWYFNLI